MLNCEWKCSLCKLFIYRNSKIVLDCQADNQSDSSPMRWFEALACGSTVLTYKKERFDIMLNVRHKKGLIINFVFSGYINEKDFHMEDFKVKVDGTEEASGNLSLI